MWSYGMDTVGSPSALDILARTTCRRYNLWPPPNTDQGLWYAKVRHQQPRLMNQNYSRRVYCTHDHRDCCKTFWNDFKVTRIRVARIQNGAGMNEWLLADRPNTDSARRRAWRNETRVRFFGGKCNSGDNRMYRRTTEYEEYETTMRLLVELPQTQTQQRACKVKHKHSHTEGLVDKITLWVS